MVCIYSEEILAFARQALGDQEKGELLQSLCQAASGELRARLREGVAPEDIRETFVTAAGVLALSLYTALEEAALPGEVKAGSLSVKKGGGGASAAVLRQQAEALLAAYLQDQGFAFLGVKG
ncbi:MAG: hypothetical protein ACI4PC_07245 [Oscillospiraceae bacterium]